MLYKDYIQGAIYRGLYTGGGGGRFWSIGYTWAYSGTRGMGVKMYKEAM